MGGADVRFSFRGVMHSTGVLYLASSPAERRHMETMLIGAAYCAYAAFWIRFFTHSLMWWRAAQRLRGPDDSRSTLRACALTVMDAVLLFRVLNANPALWIGEWAFHTSFLFVVLRHLRYVLDPVPLWVWRLQTPGLIGGYILPFALAYVLLIRLLTKHEKYTAPANMFLITSWLTSRIRTKLRSPRRRRDAEKNKAGYPGK